MTGKKGTIQLRKSLKNQIQLAVAFTLLLMFAVWVVFVFILDPDYQASSQLLIEESASAIPHLAVESNRIDAQTIEAYASFVTSAKILEQVKKDLNLKISTSDLLKQIHVDYTNNSPVLTVIVSSDDSQQSALIANTMAFVFQNEVRDSLKADYVSVISQASAENKKESVSQEGLMLGLAIAAAAGLILSLLMIFTAEAAKTAANGTNRDIRKKENQMQTVFK
ncbi:capsule biosynthesis protein CapA [Planococcus sp. ISL-110]|uniref:YveK family protein n=1 Tax=Planococcus sp. ISL-110 TaxID=2819167 RepID=UPI001BEACE09|nr:capsule biosynthesis protein CapA [Planococcus sp. ISL-110]MBT2570469.1 capsule biosynthesis protein CapA [Planococcus sp. ISL-110]